MCRYREREKELKPCPICGSKDVWAICNCDYSMVYCTSCNCQVYKECDEKIHSYEEDALNEAIVNWNDRAGTLSKEAIEYITSRALARYARSVARFPFCADDMMEPEKGTYIYHLYDTFLELANTAEAVKTL